MKGPWLPLYGSGAVVILIATTPFKEYPVLVYFVGAIVATVLEYVTGVVMLALFKIRYWDYRYRKIQFQGHICLVSTIVWGFLAMFMLYVVHPPVEKFVNSLNVEFVSIATFLITLCIVYDFTNAFKEAMDLRALIIQMEELKKKIDADRELHKERIAESIAQKKEELTEAVEHKKELRREQIVELENALEELRNKLEEKSRRVRSRNPRAIIMHLDEDIDTMKKRIQDRRK